MTGRKRKAALGAIVGSTGILGGSPTSSSAFVIISFMPSKEFAGCTSFVPKVQPPFGRPFRLERERFCPRQISSRKGSLVHRTYKSGLGSDDDDSFGPPPPAQNQPPSTEPLTPDEMTTKLLSYASNIRRGRTGNFAGHDQQRGQNKSTKPRSDISVAATCSLIHALYTESNTIRHLLRSAQASESDENSSSQSLRQALSKAIVSAIRSAADSGDYGLIMRIVDATVEYATAVSEFKGAAAVLDGRIFGEAISGLARSNASQSKLKKIWNMFVDLSRNPDRTILASPPGPHELNAILSGLAQRKRVRSALDLYRTSGVEGDAFTASILFNMLASSMPDRRGAIATKSDRSAGGVETGRRDKSISSSMCWQWNEVLSILADLGNKGQLNNYAFASALKVNKQASKRFSDKSPHDGGKAALYLLDQMKEFGVTPDVVTCTSILQSLEEAGYWKQAVSLLESMEKAVSESNANVETMAIAEGKAILPPPNTFSYASVISACLRCRRVDEALRILDKLATSSLPEVAPKTWVYNRALQAYMNAQQRPRGKTRWKDSDDRFEVAAKLLNKMKEGVRSEGMDTSPDTVTYNTILAGTTLRKASNAHVIFRVLDQMSNDGLERNFITYRNAIQACRVCPAAAINILDAISKDSCLNNLPQTEKKQVFNILLDICADASNITSVADAFGRMVQEGLEPDFETFAHLARVFASESDEDGLILLLNSLQFTKVSNEALVAGYEIDIMGFANLFSPLRTDELISICSAAIASLLDKGILNGAMVVLSSMKKCRLKASEISLQSIAFEHCRLAMTSASDEFKVVRRESLQQGSKSPLLRPVQHMSSSYAKVALEIAKKMEAPSARLYCAVMKACYSSGRWSDGRYVLKRMHKVAALEARSDTWSDNASTLAKLPSLHHQLFKLCARSGNVTSALWIADAIADLSHQVRSTVDVGQEESHRILLSDTRNITVRAKDRAPLDLDMCGEDWKLLMIAASKSGHWKVCISTLELLRPFVQATKIVHILETNDSPETTYIRQLNSDYNSLSRSITAAILCFETRSQYGWAVRAIDDWIEWSGRRPPPEAVSAACRILAKRGKGQQVLSLMSRILQVPLSALSAVDEESSGSYDRIVYNEAIMALYNNGFYDRADELYVSGVAGNVLPWAALDAAVDSSSLMLDLHGMTSAVAHSAVRVALQREIQDLSRNATSSISRDVIIITGRGKGSERQYRPVIRPEVQRMLVEEFYPPLSTSSVPGNMGALQVPSNDILAWLEHQKEQKGRRMLTIADLLKDLSTQRIISALAKREAKS